MRINISTKARIIFVALLLTLTTALSPAVVGHADYGRGNIYQVAVSTGQGGPGGGGFWGWFALNQDGTFDGEATFCTHGQGAQHFAATGQYFIGQNGDFWTVNETDTFTNGTVVFNPSPTDTGIPAQYGHYNLQRIFGLPPGTEFQVNVAR